MIKAGLSNKREENRRQRSKRILEAAERLFGTYGVGPTNMEQIAAEAGVGVATVYKYFGRKRGILEAIVRPDIERMFSDAEAVVLNPPTELSIAVLTLVAQYTTLKDHWSDRKLLHALTSIGPDSDEWQNQIVEETDQRVKDQIRRLLEQFQARGDIARSTSLTAATNALFSVFNQHFMDVVGEKVTTEADIMTGMRPALEIVIAGIKK